MAIGEALAAGLGAGASAAALFAGGLSARHAIRGRRQRNRLGYTIERLLRIDFALSRRSREMDHLLERGVEWAGVDVWPQGMTGQLNYLDALTDELERTAASLRSIDDADSALGRLRDDLETLCLALGEAAQRYHRGTLNSYRTTEGAPVGMSASGREPSPTLIDDEVALHRAERSRVQYLVRSCLYRSSEHLGERYRCQWLIQRWERELLEPSLVRELPSPIDWFGGMPALD